MSLQKENKNIKHEYYRKHRMSGVKVREETRTECGRLVTGGVIVSEKCFLFQTGALVLLFSLPEVWSGRCIFSTNSI